MILQSGSIVQVKIVLDFDLGSLMKSMFVELPIPCPIEPSLLDLKSSCATSYSAFA